MEELQATIGQGALIDPDRADLSGFDLALLSVFFISYAVLGIVQLANLFGARFGIFVALIATALILGFGVGYIDFSGFCAETRSSIVCGERASGLSAFIMIWVWVSLAILPMFGLSKLLQWWRGRA